MQISRIILKILALMGLAFALTLSTAAVAPVTVGAQTDGYDGYDGYDGEDPDDDTSGDDETATPDLGGDTGGGTLPNTGGIQLLAVAGSLAAIGLTIRRLATAS